ncbi:hypothetical protein N865_19625 [Intrasporangium oryzae NRRL B-24470]|uniref:LytR/CpsA/Psr regulator C-terminal domain-containing protein n=1 Tax=Intrasporangium oryzae NRRL B-24470 TaxID=1386089 RepID=W9G582_9MICO|nr:LytR C-terminal domain-containing protein [Intrasporangium oryzae]EWS99962.1 hypothetical protein N865_19625 [Intrasporangium oryzae NRRL B-24470]
MTELEDPKVHSYRARRRRRSAITLVVLLAALAGAFYYAQSYWNASEPKPGPCTTETPTVALSPADVSINVYNATSRKGLALATSKVAVQRGFKIKAVGNDPKQATITQVAQIRYGPQGLEAAKVLAAQVPGSVLVKDGRGDDTVDLVVGNKWKAFGPVPKPVVTDALPPCPTTPVAS